jgi:hypothetical protein
VLYTEKKESDTKFNESNGPVPNDLADEDEFEGGSAMCKGDEEGATAESIDHGSREKSVLDDGEDLKVSLSITL